MQIAHEQVVIANECRPVPVGGWLLVNPSRLLVTLIAGCSARPATFISRELDLLALSRKLELAERKMQSLVLPMGRFRQGGCQSCLIKCGRTRVGGRID